MQSTSQCEHSSTAVHEPSLIMQPFEQRVHISRVSISFKLCSCLCSNTIQADNFIFYSKNINLLSALFIEKTILSASAPHAFSHSHSFLLSLFFQCHISTQTTWATSCFFCIKTIVSCDLLLLITHVL